MKIDLKRTLWLSSLCVLIGPLAQAQFCGLTNASLNGSYGYVASEAGAVLTTTSGTGTNGTGTSAPNPYSDTELGKLLGGIAAGNQFALGGVWRFDGAGNVNAAPAPGETAVHIGTYAVNPDCSVTVSLMDSFGTSTAVTQFAGVALASGAEIDLTSLSSLRSTSTSTSTSTTTTTATGSGLTIKLVRVLYQNGCSVSNLKGLYGFVLNPASIQNQASSTTTTGTTTGTGTTTTTTTASQPSVVIGYLDFDGAGHIIAVPSISAAPASSSLTSLQYTGTYTVSVDCSGTMMVSNSSTSTGGTTASSGSLTLNFVITPAQTGTGNAFAPAPGLDLSFATADESGSGYALKQ